ncbi:hypothetical protein B1B04_10165 [Lysinibacillus sp. KCTC 33748]|uniref:VOC family protein n=1 Tax=unclassified Lysinibacillus TaxID=2636778 RepID=UPI0009A6218B|nr:MULTISPECIES: hypothetical protein [unclassified Lysinibacillus]OXS74457.1 hypothetical protein B1B04_10165 [Lysinibacillus sp. KCTC 33748]SKB66950.1 hypothetical protein SAMN06295926_105216 [Lysinibacillus sp. AC-3]
MCKHKADSGRNYAETELIDKGIKVEGIENRGHAGRNFVFYDVDGNKFDVWSELSRIFKENYKGGKYE